LALGAYTVDQIISREKFGFQGWSRHLKIYVPVVNLLLWDNAKKDLQDLLSFLSGDKWEIILRQVLVKHPPKKTTQNSIEKVALFSGGSDSFISALDLLEAGNKVCFVSHYKGGSDVSIQKELIEKLKAKYPNKITWHQVWVQPNQQNEDSTTEISSRARSFLFLCLGISFANTYNDQIEFIIPENGLISLNVPLTGTRLGSHSTRTTHPFFLKLFDKIIKQIGLSNPIRNPYQFQTKGEMMISCKNQSLLKEINDMTLSCSHGDNSRYKGYSPGTHCGYCVPCLIRQAAEFKSKIGSTTYVTNIRKSPPSPRSKSGSDLKAFSLGVERFKNLNNHQILFEIISSGPLPYNSKNELDKYIDTYKRGMTEVKTFLKL
jgi:7-cyano-7-deazaguanine synthase in queuosine biosynthesis